ncbi:PLP-dependent transferase [Boletus edulis BED1]|uniref:PLP-dependent transferase n=1 Tax=Boletus edulis BED1 TaxID=1328754 RepID=A0AAD4G7Y7_BOLED|nr:PLP-dependent transferase [Boletus edulis BED1]
MSHLYRHLRVHQIFGANTDVGKTVIAAALVRASTLTNHNTFYLKPVSTGPPQHADDVHVQRYAGPHRHLLNTQCLFRYEDPVSPHLAVRMASQRSGVESSAPSDETFVNAIAEHIRACARPGFPGHMYVETAGGVHSPTLSGTTQLESYRPLFLPTVLVGDPKLGGISSTISSYESLVLRGYIVDAILLFRDDYYRNYEYLFPYFAERGVHVASLDPPPPLQGNLNEDISATEAYYANLAPRSLDGEIFHALRHLDECHVHRIKELDSMPRRTLDSIWWPFVQHGLVKSEKDVTVIDSAWADFFSVYDSSSEPSACSLLAPKLDGSASWWTQAVGHAHPSLALAAANAAGRYGHVMFPHATHLPALKLAERLVHEGPGVGWASRAFFTDNGSTGMEVALKMALRSFSINDKELTPRDKKDLWIIGLKGSYHGDTIGAMDATEEGVYTCEWHQSKGFWFEPPTVAIQNGNFVVSVPSPISPSTSSVHFDDLHSVYDIQNRLHSPLADIYRTHVRNTLQALRRKGERKLAALVLEPIVMGAGGMIFVDPLFQRVLVDAVRDKSLFENPLPVVFDEVFVGLYRLGMKSFGPLLGVNPDIAVYAKILTGGVLPLSVTLASERVFQAFNSPSKVDALLHGHSYTAHAVGCQVANTTLDMIEMLSQQDPWRLAREKWSCGARRESAAVWSFWDPGFVRSVSRLAVVHEAMTLGTVLVIKFKDDGAGYASHTAQNLLRSIESPVCESGALSAAPGGAPFGIHYRTLGNVAYFMTSLNTSLQTIEEIENRLWKTLSATIKEA